MLFRDRLLTCRSCGIRFLFSSAQQRRRAESGEQPPECCPGCLALSAWLKRQQGERHQGTVRWYDARKGYGFIRDEEGGDVFVHRSSFRLRGRVRPGERVEYTVAETDRGPTAREVVRVTE